MSKKTLSAKMKLEDSVSAKAEIYQEEHMPIDKSVVFTLRVLAPEDCFLAILPLYLEVRKPGLAIFTITTTPVNGYSHNLNLSLLDLPAGGLAIFSKNPIGPSDSATLTIDTAGINQFDTDFDITLRAVEI